MDVYDDIDHLSLDIWLRERHDYDMPAAIKDAADTAPELFAEMVFRADELGIEFTDLAKHASLAWSCDGDSYLDKYPHLQRAKCLYRLKTSMALLLTTQTRRSACSTRSQKRVDRRLADALPQ